MSPTVGQSASPPHKGILREEVLALRHIIGYTDHADPSTASTLPYMGTCLPGSRTKDVLLVAIDIDVPQSYSANTIDDHVIHIGVSIFDTRQLQKTTEDAENSTLSLVEMIENHQFAVGALSRSESAKKKSKRFLFGESILLGRSQIEEQLEGLVTGREFATVFHGTTLDLEVLNDLGVDFPSRGVYVFDTNKVAQWPLQLEYRLSLGKLCAALGIPFGRAHVAGNDAHFTLRALLMLALKDAHMLHHIGCALSGDFKFWRIHQIGLAPIPVPDLGVSQEEMQQRGKERRAANLETKLRKKARKQVRKQLRQEAATDTTDKSDDEYDEESMLSTLFEEKYQELCQFQQLPRAERFEIKRQERDAWMARQQEEQAAGETAVSDAVIVLPLRPNPSS